jgi:hypothetical protein
MSCNVSGVLEPAVQDPVSLRPLAAGLGHNLPQPQTPCDPKFYTTGKGNVN